MLQKIYLNKEDILHLLGFDGMDHSESSAALRQLIEEGLPVQYPFGPSLPRFKESQVRSWAETRECELREKTRQGSDTAEFTIHLHPQI